MINFFQQNRKVFFFFGDTLLIIIAVYLAFLLRFEGRIPSQYFDGVLQGAIVLALLFSLPIFYFFRLFDCLGHMKISLVNTQQTRWIAHAYLLSEYPLTKDTLLKVL